MMGASAGRVRGFVRVSSVCCNACRYPLKDIYKDTSQLYDKVSTAEYHRPGSMATAAKGSQLIDTSFSANGWE